MATSTPLRPSTASRPRDDRPAKRKKEQRTDIWSNLLRQTREAQARSRTQTLQQRDLIICGGSSDDQRAFVQGLARPPPPQPPGRNQQQSRQRPRGEVKLSNRFAYGFGHVTLFSPPQGNAGMGMGMLGGESEEVARVECHCFPGRGEGGFEHTLRRLLVEKRKDDSDDTANVDGGQESAKERKKPGVALLLSWKEPWTFLEQIRRWFQLLARALIPPEQVLRIENPLEILKEAGLALTVVVQHVEAQEGLEREKYTEESFEYISQCLRTCILPLAAGLVYTSASTPPQPPSAPLSDAQKVLFTSLDLDLGALSPKAAGRPGSSSGVVKKDELAPRHNFFDRMAIVVPSGHDSVGKIRLLSETFSPEALMDGWISDLNIPQFSQPTPPALQGTPQPETDTAKGSPQTNGGAEVFESASPPPASPIVSEPPTSPSKMPRSAITPYLQNVEDPNAHKRPQPPKIEVETKPEQQFLAEMRSQLQRYEQQDAERQRREPGLVSSTAGSLRGASSGAASISQEGQTGALSDLGDVAFNVGGVSYNAVSAEAAIERLKRPTPASPSQAPDSPLVTTPRQSTPRPPKRDQRDGGGSASRGVSTAESGEVSTPGRSDGGSGKGGDMNIDQLEQYFHSLMKRGGTPGGSAQGTPEGSRRS